MSHDQPDEYVLVVDDDADIREAMVEVFIDRDCAVIAASNGQEALDVLRRGPGRPCVILLDLMMPVMDGKTFCVELGKDPALRDIPVVVMSAHANLNSVVVDIAVAAKLPKPVQVEPLLALVNTHCKHMAAGHAHTV